MSDKRQHHRIAAEINRTELSSDPFVAAMCATRMPMIITNPNQSDNPIVFVNDAFCKLREYSRNEILGRNCRFLQGPETNAECIKKVREAIADRAPIEIEIVNHKKNGEKFWNRLNLQNDSKSPFRLHTHVSALNAPSPEQARYSRKTEGHVGMTLCSPVWSY